MMNYELQIAICDDDDADRAALVKIIHQCLNSVKCFEFCTAKNIIEDFYPDKFDLIIMDIYMDDISGIDAAAKIRETDSNVSIAFATASVDHALESYRLGAIKYLEKPIEIKQVRELLDFVMMKKQHTEYVTIGGKRHRISIPASRILYAEQQSHNLIVYLSNGQRIQTAGKLDDLFNMLNKNSFFKSHKSYIVNFAYVKGIDQELMVFNMHDGSNAHISRQRFAAAKSAYESYLFEKVRNYDKF